MQLVPRLALRRTAQTARSLPFARAQSVTAPPALSSLSRSGVDPERAFARRAVPRSQRPGYVPLSTSHPAFGPAQVDAAVLPPMTLRKKLLSTEHPAFGTRRTYSNTEGFDGPVTVSGFFLAVDPNVSVGTRSQMNPNAQLTIRDAEGNMARVRYRCHLVSTSGLKAEALIRFQVGWVSPPANFSHAPHVVRLGKGVDLSVPYLFHLTMISMLDECGDNSGSTLYFSGTPMLGFSAGFNRLSGGKLVLSPTKEMDPLAEGSDFIGHVHYRQLGFLVFKVLVYVACFVACLPAARRLLAHLIPDPFHRFSEKSTSY